MKFNLHPRVVFVSFLLLLPCVTNAQWYNRMEVGYSYVTATAHFSGKSGFYDLNDNRIGDTTVNRNISAKAGAGYSLGLYVPLKRGWEEKYVGRGYGYCVQRVYLGRAQPGL